VNRRTSAAHVEIRVDDASLSPHAGLLPLGELVRRLNLVERVDRAVNEVRAFKQRNYSGQGPILSTSRGEHRIRPLTNLPTG
jgi:hypothetical protein